MKTPVAAGSKFIPSLDGVRAVSVMIVILGHAHVPKVPAGVGVTVFFFLSGYLITTLLRLEHRERASINLRDFYLRRALRILPPLYVTLALILVMVSAGALSGNVRLDGTAAAALHFANYWQVFGDASQLPRGSGVFWSVAVEEHFYILFPIAYIALLHRYSSRMTQGKFIAAACAGFVLWRCVLVGVFGVSHEWLAYATDARGDSILLGCLLAIVANPYLDPVRVTERMANWFLLPAGVLALFAVGLAPGAVQNVAGYTIQGVAMMGILTALVAYPTSPAARFLNWRPVAFIGVLSYCLYLTHRLIQIPMQEHWGWGWVETAFGSLVVAVGVSWLMHVTIERPATRLRRRLAHAHAVESHVDSEDASDAVPRGRGQHEVVS